MTPRPNNLPRLDLGRLNGVFAPLDPAERIPREHLEKARFQIYKDDPGWRHLASFLWPPAATLAIALAMTRFASVPVALVGSATLFVAFAWFILHRRRA